MTDDQRPMTNDRRPMTDDERPTTSDDRRTTDERRPMTNDGRPTTTDRGRKFRPSSFVVRRPPSDTLIAGAIFLASLLLYAVTAAPSVATLFDDSLEFHVVLPTLGIAHPSGYPLYTLLGKLFTLLLPFRDPAGRANLLSALCAAAAVGLLYLVARRLAGSRPAALTATVAFAISPAWWSQATLAEVYALHGLLVALFIYCLLRWKDDPSAICNLQSAILVFGLGLAHHRMIALLLPAALIFVAWTAIQGRGGLSFFVFRSSSFVRLLLCALAPLLLYLYLPLRGQAVGSLDGAFRPTLQGTLDWVTARGYSVFLTGNPFGVSRTAGYFASLFLAQMGALPMIAALWGLATGWRYGLRRYAFLLLATAAQIGFGVVYKVEDVEVFFIPAFMLITLWAAIGLAPVFDSAALWVSSLGRLLRLPRGLRPAVLSAGALVVAAVFLFQPVSDAVRDFPQRDRSHTWEVYDYGQDVLTSVAPGGRIVGLLGETTLVRYFRDVLGQRPDVTVVPADAEAARFAAVEAGLAQGQPVYLTRDLPGAATRYSLDAAGPLIAVSPKAKPAAPPAGQALGAGILLTDARQEIRQTHAGPVVRLALTWAAAAPIREELKVSARLLDAAGQAIVIEDRAPVHFTYPTTAWVPGETVRDVYDLRLPPGATSGSYAVLLILYRAADGSEVGRVQLPGSAIR